MVPGWLSDAWGAVFGDDEAGAAQTGEEKRRVFEATASKAVCEGLTREELNAIVRQFKSWPLSGDLYWWLHEYDAAEFEGLRQIGGCPSEQYTPATVTDTQVALALEQERQRSRRWMMGVAVGAAALVGVAAWALWPRRARRRGRR